MSYALAIVRTAIVVAFLAVSAAVAQMRFEDTELAGWSTEVSGLPDRTVSGAAQADGGNPGAHHLVRHTHELFDFFATSVSSASLSPVELDPAESGLAGTPRLSVDLRFEVADAGPQPLPPTLYWTPMLEQGGTLYRYANPADVAFSTRDTFVRVEADLRPNRWSATSEGQGPDFSAGAPPVRLGLLLQSDVFVPLGEQGEARVRIDNVRLDAIEEDALPAVSLVAVPSPEGGHVVFAPPECFDGLADDSEETFEVRAEIDADWDGCVEVETPDLQPDSTFRAFFCFDPDLPGSREESREGLTCQAAPPSFVELLPPSGRLRARLGTPSRARVEPCLVRVAGGDLSCSDLRQTCPVEVAFGLLCSTARSGMPCYLESLLEAPGVEPRGRGAARLAAAATPVETLRRVRDEAMATSIAGRYYRDLYDAFSPELRELLLADLRFVRDVLATAPPWLDALGALIDGGGDEATLTPSMVAEMLGVFDRFEAQASPALREVFRRERERLRLEDTAGLSIADAVALAEQRGGPSACATAETTLCLQGGRFRVEVTWADFQGGSGSGQAVPLSGDSGYFWFFDQANVELVVKVLDGRTINDRYWVFYGALSNVEFTVLVTDTVTGALRAYRNPSGVFASVGDTGAFTPDGAPREGSTVAEDGDEASLLTRLTATASETVRRGWRRVRDVFRGETVVAQRAMPRATQRAQPVTQLTPGARLGSIAPSVGACVPGTNALCLAGNRFRVEVEWRDFTGGSGFGMAAPLTADTGTFWFFDASNTELIVKVLDARAVNDHFWVFYGALSNVEYTLRVTDTATGAVRTYRNPAGDFASRGDVEAF